MNLAVDKSHNQQCTNYSAIGALSVSFAGAKLAIDEMQFIRR